MLGSCYSFVGSQGVINKERNKERKKEKKDREGGGKFGFCRPVHHTTKTAIDKVKSVVDLEKVYDIGARDSWAFDDSKTIVTCLLSCRSASCR